MKSIKYLLTPFLLLSLIACSDNPVSHDDEDEELTVSLQISEDDVHTLDNIIFTAVIADHHGDPVTDFEEVSVQYRIEGTVDWRDLVLDQVGTNFVGTYMFMSSGEYEIRVMGLHHGETVAELLYELSGHLEVGRAHTDVGGFRVEFENFPGHMHEGDVGQIRFWIMEDSAARTPVAGLLAEIHCGDPNGSEESHNAVESEPGVYEATHTFLGAGEAHLAVHFEGVGGIELEADFHIPVVHGH